MRASAVAGEIRVLGHRRLQKFNTDHGHATVDIDLLPQFHLAIEAHVYERGRAYREGGDEYLLVLPEMSAEHVRQFLLELEGAPCPGYLPAGELWSESDRVDRVRYGIARKRFEHSGDPRGGQRSTSESEGIRKGRCGTWRCVTAATQQFALASFLGRVELRC